jgi:hypothetical protein
VLSVLSPSETTVECAPIFGISFASGSEGDMAAEGVLTAV